MADDTSTSSGMSRPPEMREDGSVDEGAASYQAIGDLKNKYWYPHFAGCVLWFSWILFVPFFVLGSVLPPIEELGGAILVITMLPLMALSIYAGLGAVIGYYYDAKDMRKSSVDYRPRWWLWVIAHLIFSPLFISPIYLLRRRSKIGSPTKAEMKSALLFWRSSNSGTSTAAD